MNLAASIARRTLGPENARLLYRLVIESGWPHRWSYALAGLLMLVVSGMFAAIALLMRDVFNEVFIAEDPRALRWLAAVVLTIFLVRGAAMRARIALVTQETFLFDDTIAENIRLGRPDATRAEVEAAARAANAHGFIAGLPCGYDSPVGEAGAQLSGGQRQRVAIARAMLRDAPILLLDEATSALDAESEAHVQEALGRLMQGRTTVVIAHRLATIRRADKIAVMEAGRVVEQGSHDYLVAQRGLYARLAELQFGSHVESRGATA